MLLTYFKSMNYKMNGGEFKRLHNQARPLPLWSVGKFGEDPVPANKIRIRNQNQARHFWRNIMAMLVAIFLWMSSSNLVLAAPDVEISAIPDPQTGAVPSEPEESESEDPESSLSQRLVTFSYKDTNFEQVSLKGSFTNWEEMPMTRKGGTWSIILSVPTSQQYYNFQVDEDYDSWVAIDPDNPNASNHEEFGWVSVLGSGHKDLDSDRDKTRQHRKAERREKRAYKKRILNELEHGQLLMEDVTYQRVDGLVVGTGLTHIGDEGTLSPSARVRGHFGFSSGRFGGGLTVLQPLIPDHFLDLKLNVFDKTMYNNHITGVGTDENSLAGLVLHEDYHDYHRSKGVRISLVMKLGAWMRLQGGVRTEEQASLWAPSVWSIKKGTFSPNPDIDDGSMNTVFGNLVVGGTFNYISASYQRSSESLVGGDFDFEKVDAKIRGRLKMGPDAGFDIRLAAGTNLQGSLPTQERYLLGGLGTVRGYYYQSLMIADTPETANQFGGESMALGNLEYFFRLGTCLKLALYYDAGMVWADKDAVTSLNQLKTSTGFGVNIGRGDGLRINMTQRLDDRTLPVVFQLRLKRMF